MRSVEFRMLLLLFLSLASAEFLTPVDEDVDNSTLPEFCFEENVISCILVRPNPAALLSSSLELADVVLEYLDQPGNNTFTFTTEDGDEATFSIDEESGEIWGNAELADGRDFVLEPSSDSCKGCHAWIEEDRAAFPTDYKVELPPATGEEKRSLSAWNSKKVALFAKGKEDKTTLVTYTVKVYYTAEVKKKVKNLPTMVDSVIGKTNQGYINSKIPIRVKLHCLEQTKTSEAEGMNTLDAFRLSKGDTVKLRGSADAAALLIMTHPKGYCGVGYMPDRMKPDQIANWDFPDAMLSLSVASCATSTPVFGHEISHNFGNDHDKYDNANNVFPWGLGYHIPGLDVRTLMAYIRPDKFGGGYLKDINFYSNPDVKFKGVPTGKKGVANAARVIREHRFAIAAIGDESEKCGTASSASSSASTTAGPATPATTASATTENNSGNNYDNYDYGTTGRGGSMPK